MQNRAEARTIGQAMGHVNYRETLDNRAFVGQGHAIQAFAWLRDDSDDHPSFGELSS